MNQKTKVLKAESTRSRNQCLVALKNSFYNFDG